METLFQAIQELIREKNQAVSQLWEYQNDCLRAQPDDSNLDKLIRLSDIKYENRIVYFRMVDYEVEKLTKLILYCLNHHLATLEIVGILDFQTGQIEWLNRQIE